MNFHHVKANTLFAPYELSEIKLQNRIVMSPMTRSRAVGGRVPNPLAADYYAQRASAGLIITEATQVSPQGVGYVRTPGIHSKEQVEGWKKITSAVHKAGGKIFLQLWHVGRISHADFHDGKPPVAPSAIAAEGKTWTEQGQKDYSTPRALEASELPGIVEDFRRAAQNTKDAGFDGVEIHGANGYLLDQFTRDGSNKRTDNYGGSLENRLRFPLEVVDAVVSVWGADRVGYRLSPYFTGHSMSDSNPVATFSQLVDELNQRKLGYIHVVDSANASERITPLLRELFSGTYIVAEGFDRESGTDALTRGEADLIAYGKPFISNPDLPARYKNGKPLAEWDASTFYATGPKGDAGGYTDYPAAK
ncbi:MAG TPA: alkene reductase [Xanthobacteraceae bacterium]|nr:alkene reductase [Xanthobacteraceae bacterium]